MQELDIFATQQATSGSQPARPPLQPRQNIVDRQQHPSRHSQPHLGSQPKPASQQHKAGLSQQQQHSFQYDVPTQGHGPDAADDIDGMQDRSAHSKGQRQAGDNAAHLHKQARTGVRLVDQHVAQEQSRQSAGQDALAQRVVHSHDCQHMQFGAQEQGQGAEPVSSCGRLNQQQQQQQQQQGSQMVSLSTVRPVAPDSIGPLPMNSPFRVYGGMPYVLQQIHDHPELYNGLTVGNAES